MVPTPRKPVTEHRCVSPRALDQCGWRHQGIQCRLQCRRRAKMRSREAHGTLVMRVVEFVCFAWFRPSRSLAAGHHQPRCHQVSWPRFQGAFQPQDYWSVQTVGGLSLLNAGGVCASGCKKQRSRLRSRVKPGTVKNPSQLLGTGSSQSRSFLVRKTIDGDLLPAQGQSMNAPPRQPPALPLGQSRSPLMVHEIVQVQV